MAIPPSISVAAQIAAELGNPAIEKNMLIIVDAILAAVKQAELATGAVSVPITGAAGTTPAAGTGPILK